MCPGMVHWRVRYDTNLPLAFSALWTMRLRYFPHPKNGINNHHLVKIHSTLCRFFAWFSFTGSCKYLTNVAHCHALCDRLVVCQSLFRLLRSCLYVIMGLPLPSFFRAILTLNSRPLAWKVWKLSNQTPDDILVSWGDMSFHSFRKLAVMSWSTMSQRTNRKAGSPSISEQSRPAALINELPA